MPKSGLGGMALGAGVGLALPWLLNKLTGPSGPGLTSGPGMEQIGGYSARQSSEMAGILAREAMRNQQLFSQLRAIRSAYEPAYNPTWYAPGISGTRM